MIRWFVVDNDPAQLAEILRAATKAGLDREHAVVCSELTEAERAILGATQHFDIAVVDLALISAGFDTHGIGIIQNLKEHHPDCTIFALTGYEDVKTSVQAMKAGATDIISLNWLHINGMELLRKKLAIYRVLKNKASA